MFGFVVFCLLVCIYGVWTVYVRGQNGLKHPPMYPGLIPIIGHSYLLLGDGIRLWRNLKQITAETIIRGGVTRFMFGTSLYYGINLFKTWVDEGDIKMRKGILVLFNCRNICERINKLLVITDPEDALTVANACLQKHYSYDYAKPWLGDGLITGSGEIWKRHRKLLTPAFSLPIMHSFLGVFNSQARKLVDILQPNVSKGWFDHTDYLRNISLESFCMTAFGITGFEDKNFIENYMSAVDQILWIITGRFQNFWLHSDLIFKWSGQKKKYDDLVEIIHSMSNEVIQRKRKAEHNIIEDVKKASGLKYKAFLDLLLELSEENALSDKEIREEVDTAIMTGFDTSSSALSYIMLLLGANPRVQDKLLAEIKQVFATDRDVEKEDLPKLVYTEAVIKESLRIFTTGPVTLRYIDKEVRLKNCTLQANTQSIILLFGAHRNLIWGKDIEEFRPERWLEPELQSFPSYFLAFSLGKRSCLGRTYAMITMKTTLVHFLRRYKITAGNKDLQLRMDFLLKPVSGHEIKIEERIDSSV